MSKPVSNPVISRDPEVMGGTPVFAGTRVPVRILTDHLLDNYTLNYFLDQYPTVSREQAEGFLELARETLAAEDEPDASPGEQAEQLLELARQGP